MELGKLFYRIGLKGMNEFKSDVQQTEDTVEGSSSGMTNAFKKIGMAVATYFTVDKIVDFGKAVVNAAAEVSAESSAFEQIMGDYSNSAQQKMNEVANATGAVESRLTPYMTSMTAKFKGLGYDIDDATTLATEGLTLASDAAAFWDKSLDDSMGALNSFINGSYEGGEAVGLFANDTQMASYAVEKGIVSETKAWSKLDEATKQATRLEYAKAMFEQSGATGQAAKEAGQYANVQANLTEKWRQFKAQIGEPLLQNIVIPAMDKLSEVVDLLSVRFQKLTDFYVDNKTAVNLLTVTVGGFVLGLGAYKGALLAVDGANKIAALSQKLLNAAQMASPHMWVVAGLTAVVTAIIYLYNNCEWFRNMLNALWSWIKTELSGLLSWFTNNMDILVNFIINAWNNIMTFIRGVMDVIKGIFTLDWNLIKQGISNVVVSIKNQISNVFNSVKSYILNTFSSIKNTTSSIWNSIKDAIKNPIQSAKNFVQSMIDKIKGLMNFSWSLPHLKLPHISIKGKFNLLPPSVPKFGISWYAKGGILEKPTIFGVNGPNLMAGGEAGPEAVAPISELRKYLNEPDDQTNRDILDVLLNILNLLSDENRIRDFIVDIMDKAGFNIELDGREVGRLVRKYA